MTFKKWSVRNEISNYALNVLKTKIIAHDQSLSYLVFDPYHQLFVTLRDFSLRYATTNDSTFNINYYYCRLRF